MSFDVEPKTIEQGPDAQLVSIVLVRKDQRLQYTLGWKAANYTEQQRYDMARAIDRIIRTHVPAWREAVERVDKHAILGKKVAALPQWKRRLLGVD